MRKRSAILALSGLLGWGCVAAECTLEERWKAVENPVSWDLVVHEQADKEYQPRVQLLNVWAIWCAPCRQELPVLAQLHAHEHLAVQLLNLGDEPEAARALLQELGVAELPLQLGAELAFLKQFGASGIPLTVLFVDEVARFRLLGILSDEAEVVAYAQCVAEADKS